MSLPPEAQPDVSGVSAPDTWTLGHAEDAPSGMKLTAIQPLTEETYAAYRDAVEFVLARQDQASLKLVIGNYTEFRALQASMAIVFTTTKQANWPDPAQSQFHLRRILLNWLNSIRLFDDHNRARIVRTYGDTSPELNAYKIARSEIYDEGPSYRFMFELRNYAQHCGEVPVQAQIRIDSAGSTLDLHFDRDELLSKFGNWKKVKADLESGPEHIGIDTPIEETMAAVTKLAQAVAAIDMPKFKSSIEQVQDVLGPPPEDTNLRTVIFRMRTSTDDSGAEVMKMDLDPILLVQQTSADEEAAKVEVPDFSSHRPPMTTDKSTRRCQGPLNKVTHLPSESCQEIAAMSFYFPHQAGLAFLFACDQHALSLGQWAGKRFGGCFGGEAEKAETVRRMAAERSIRIDEPHGSEYDRLIRVPGAPHIDSLFGGPTPTGEAAPTSE